MTIASAALLLFLILDPLGNVPVFLSLLRGLPPRRQRIVLARELLLAWKAGIISTASFWALAGCVGIVLVANNFDSLLWRFEYARAPLELLFGACVAYALMRRRAAAAHA